ncbi:type I phosphomannose isomerase catalytic subunit, partial [Pseudoalteromonas fuliginea]
PLIFEPILKERIWGGTKLKTDLGKNIPNDITGESRELSDVPGDMSVVKNGAYAGKPLIELLKAHPEAVLGDKVYDRFGLHFPLLFKFLDAHNDLSIQVHPNDELAKKRHNSFGKTEM